MSSTRRRIAIVLLALGFVVASASSAYAAAIWQTGVKLSSAPSFALMPGDVWIAEGKMYAEDAYGCRSGATVSTAALREDGDYIYVRDDCKDGRSAIARLLPMWGDSDVDARVCRNSSGEGTWVRCNFNWPEGVQGCFHAGVYNANTGFLRYDRNFGYEICGEF